MTAIPRGYVLIEATRLNHLNACYFSPLAGMRDLAAGLVDEWGHDPDEHPELMDLLEVELSGALVETASDLMRGHGLRDLRVEPVTA
jgi:hypothetical protein